MRKLLFILVSGFVVAPAMENPDQMMLDSEKSANKRVWDSAKIYNETKRYKKEKKIAHIDQIMEIAHTKNLIKLSKTQKSKLLDLMKDDKEIPLLDAVVKALNTRLSELANANWNALSDYDRTFRTYLPYFFSKMLEAGITADNEKALQVLIDNAITPSNLCKIGVYTKGTVICSSEKLLILFAKSNAVDREGLCGNYYPLVVSLHSTRLDREASILLYYGALLPKRKDWERVPDLEKKHALRVGRMAQYLQRCLFTEESSSLIAKDDRIKRSTHFEICEKIAEYLYGPLDSEQRKIVAHLPPHNYLVPLRIHPDTRCGSCMKRADHLEGSILITNCCNTLICRTDAENKQRCPRCDKYLELSSGKIVEYRFS